MSEFRRRLLLKLMKIHDLGVVTFAVLLASSAVSSTFSELTFSEFLSLRISVQNVILFAAFLTICLLVFSYCRLYHSKRIAPRVDELFDVTQAVSVNTMVIFLFSLAFDLEVVTWLFLAVFWSGCLLILFVNRMVLRVFLAQVRKRGRNLRHVVIVGTNRRALQFAHKIESNPALGYTLLGFIDDGWVAGTPAGETTRRQLLCNIDGLPDYLRDNVVDEIVIGLPLKSAYETASGIVHLCEKQGIIVRFLSDFFNLRSAQTRAEELDEQTLLSMYTGRVEGWPAITKRIFDLLVSLTLLIVFSPVFLLTALLIKATSTGPVFFVQERVGLGKRRFKLFKFRTMVADAERRQAELEESNEVSGPVFKIRNDPRVTMIGRLLRKTSVDELPQLINVFKGEMSLVGPRPLPVRDYSGFNKDWHRRRFSVRPGITCLWQVNGRSDIPFDRWMELDMEYIDKWSLWLDFKILAKTIPAVFRGIGAA